MDPSQEAYSGRILLEVNRDFYASSSKELPVSKGEIVKYLDHDRGWIRAKTSDGFVGYIPARCCRAYDAKKIRQRRKQQFTGVKDIATGVRMLETTGQQKSSRESKENKDNKLKHFINTAVCEAITNMTVGQGTRQSPENPTREFHFARSADEIKIDKHLNGVCGRSCRLCYGENGQKRPGTKDQQKYKDYNKHSKSCGTNDSTYFTNPSQVAVMHTPKPESDIPPLNVPSNHKRTSQTEHITNDSSSALETIKEDRSDSGIYVAQNDECDCSRCSSELDTSSKTSQASKDNSYQHLHSPLLSPLERYFSSGNLSDETILESTKDNSSTPEYVCCQSSKGSDSLLVLRNFVGEEEEDLTVWKGDIVTLLNDSERDWIWIRDQDGQQGYIPRAYATDNSCKECESLLKESLSIKMASREKSKEEAQPKSPSPISEEGKDSKTDSGKGVRFFVLSDHVGTSGNTVSVNIGDVVVANMKDQLIDGWLWIYCPDKKLSGYLPENILLEADPIEVTEV